MRDQGRLIEWFDEKGYGFIQPNDNDKDRVFLHIKDFARPGPRPIVGCALEYQVILDERGRYRAKQVTYLKAAQTQKRVVKRAPAPPVVRASAAGVLPIFAIVYIVAVAILSFTHLLPAYSFMFITLMNVLSYWLYAQDKEAVQLGNRRVPEQTLHIISFLGGWPAAWLAQQKLRHKTQKQPFRKIYFCSIVFNILLLLWLISPFNAVLR